MQATSQDVQPHQQTESGPSISGTACVSQSVLSLPIAATVPKQQAHRPDMQAGRQFSLSHLLCPAMQLDSSAALEKLRWTLRMPGGFHRSARPLQRPASRLYNHNRFLTHHHHLAGPACGVHRYGQPLSRLHYAARLKGLVQLPTCMHTRRRPVTPLHNLIMHPRVTSTSSARHRTTTHGQQSLRSRFVPLPAWGQGRALGSLERGGASGGASPLATHQRVARFGAPGRLLAVVAQHYDGQDGGDAPQAEAHQRDARARDLALAQEVRRIAVCARAHQRRQARLSALASRPASYDVGIHAAGREMTAYVASRQQLHSFRTCRCPEAALNIKRCRVMLHSCLLVRIATLTYVYCERT